MALSWGCSHPCISGKVRTTLSIAVVVATEFGVLLVVKVGMGVTLRGQMSLPCEGFLRLNIVDLISHLGDLPRRKVLNIPTNRSGEFWGEGQEETNTAQCGFV